MVVGMSMGMALGSLGVASAQTNPFPTTKEPGSAKFDISGFYHTTEVGGTQSSSSGDTALRINGGGAVSGKNMQLDMTIYRETPETAGDPIDPNDPNLMKISIILLDGKLYFKLPSLTGEDRWVVTDASGLTPGSLTGSMMGMAGPDPRYAGAFTVTQEGKETLNGAPTTMYRIDVDYAKLLSAMGAGPGTSLPPGSMSDVQYVMHVWVGDNDMYLHQMNMSLDGTFPIPGSDASLLLGFDFTMTFRDFDQPVTITAPPNAEELDLSSLGIDPNAVSVGGLLGMPGIGTSVTDMPRTGSPSGGFPFEAAIVVALGLLCLVLGGMARRASIRM
jgi:hypothetical protein